MRRIAVLTSGNADDQEFKPALAAFQQRLQHQVSRLSHGR
jgi:hypothetical protein